MQSNRKTNDTEDLVMKPQFAGTDPQKVKQQIQKDIKNGEGSMTSREAGGLRD
ncbi:hypothetical protein [Aquibacillus rhizosphaerae]|uniref:Uncharacterized protein n=1 Tax=Aquibacillus rhizosphaerae TaxID=3051431 RepID=A0ABT7L2I0_9BACI|nr:hypothetical protein [Aquibacillus sp. LR5S19]MDL4839422.1 hypothetical protein [Aquibacillus sp. LR5S19]